MAKYVWGGMFLAVFVVTATFWSIKPLVQYRRVMPKDIPRRLPTEQQYALIEQKLEEKTPLPRRDSKAVVRVADFDFGMMDPHAELSHTFQVRNEGLEVLKLGDPDSRCDCATAELSMREIAPGSSGDVTIYWTPKEKIGKFGVTVDIPTSDPAQPRVSLNVHGIVRQRLSAEPGSLVLGDVRRGQTPPAGQTLIYSHVWNDFTIDAVEDATGTLAGFHWEVQPAAPAPLAEKQALAGYQLRVQLPDNLPTGPLAGQLRILARVAGEPEPLAYYLDVSAQVRGSLTIHGSNIDSTGVVDLGIVQRGTQKRVRLLAKVRDVQTELPNIRWETQPAFVQASLQPVAGAPGAYTLEIVIPPDAPAATHLRPDQYGSLTLLTDHPRVPSTKLKLRLAVSERQSAVP